MDTIPITSTHVVESLLSGRPLSQFSWCELFTARLRNEITQSLDDRGYWLMGDGAWLVVRRKD